jgi:hypothetical protein
MSADPTTSKKKTKRAQNLSRYMAYVPTEHAHILTEAFLNQCTDLADELDRVYDIQVKLWNRIGKKVYAMDLTLRKGRDAMHQVHMITQADIKYRRCFGVEWATVLCDFYKDPESNTPYNYTTHTPETTPLKLTKKMMADLVAFADAQQAVYHRRDELWATISTYAESLDSVEALNKFRGPISYACVDTDNQIRDNCFTVEFSLLVSKLIMDKR